MNQLLSVPSQVGLVLRAVRKSAKLSQKQLAAKLGLSQNRLSELETGPGSMRVDQLLAVISVLGLELQVQTRGGSPVTGSKGSDPDNSPRARDTAKSAAALTWGHSLLFHVLQHTAIAVLKKVERSSVVVEPVWLVKPFERLCSAPVVGGSQLQGACKQIRAGVPRLRF